MDLLRSRAPRGLPEAAALGIVLACLAPPAPAAEAPAKPNIVFVLADDLGFRSAPAGAMPRVQEMARQGTTFARAFTSSPICSPARATLFTGKYPQNTTVRSNRLPSGGYENFFASGQENETFAVWLQRAGYRTALIGKYINYYPVAGRELHVPKGWSRWTVPNHGSMHMKYGFSLNEDGRYRSYDKSPANYATDLYARKARAFVDAAADAGAPFALVLSLNAPHAPFEPAPRHAHLFPQARAPRLPSFPERDMGDKPPFLRLAPIAGESLRLLDETYRKRLRMLRSVDEAVGGLRDLLRERGLLHRTYFVFSSDNGWRHGEHNLTPGKGRAYEEDARVPLVVTGPGVPARTVNRLIGNADIAPTFAAWGRARVPAGVDGRSFAGLLKAADPAAFPWRRRVPFLRSIEGKKVRQVWPDTNPRPGDGTRWGCFAHLPDSSSKAPEFRGFRSDRHTYVEYETGEVELYDNLEDPYQLRNMACRASPALRASFRRAAATLANCKAGTCRAAEDW